MAACGVSPRSCKMSDLHDKAKACLEELIEKYPDTTYAEEAKRKLREIK